MLWIVDVKAKRLTPACSGKLIFLVWERAILIFQHLGFLETYWHSGFRKENFVYNQQD